MKAKAFQLHLEDPVYSPDNYNSEGHVCTYLAKASVKIFDILAYKARQLKASFNLTSLHFFTALQALVAKNNILH